MNDIKKNELSRNNIDNNLDSKDSYLKFFKNQISVVLLNDTFSQKDFEELGKTINYFTSKGLYFILCINPQIAFQKLLDNSGNLDEMDPDDLSEIEEGILAKMSLHVKKSFEETGNKINIILDSRAYIEQINNFSNLELNLETIGNDLHNGTIPIVVPFITDINRKIIRVVDYLDFTKQVAINSGAKKLIIPTIFNDEIEDISMMSPEYAKQLLTNKNISYKLKSFLKILIEFVESNESETRGHILKIPSDLKQEIETVEGIGTMISANSIKIINEDDKTYSKNFIKR